MKICQVLGPVVSTAKHAAYSGRKLLALQPLDERGQPIGSSIIAVDDVQAGRGDVVLVLQEGNGIRQILRQGAQVPIRSLIVGIIDRVEVAPA